MATTLLSTPSSAPQTSQAPRATRSRRRRATGRTIVLATVAYLVAIVFVLPYAEMVISGLRPANELSARTYLPTALDWSNFVDIWSTGLATNLRVSLIVAGGATLLVLAVALPAAYYTARHRFRGRGAFLLLVLVTQMFQPAAMLVGIYREFLSLNLIDSIAALILVNAGFNLAFATWILNAYFASIPVELEEAALLDGMTRLGALRRITIPLAMPGIVTALIFTFIGTWNEFLVALTLTTTPENQPLTVALNAYIGQYQVDWGHLFAGSVIATIPVIVLFAFIEGKVVGGLTAGSVK
ncbi:carbohydrate ABC transporter permease [Leifsonia shinshuensis]|uniref:carbohydrate ABC transporter permease n=1 Tax=Leifsonia shinshuensis TaxID=150026 RepID=UPI001F504E90|nr:carbohydrate ABC transporter permease [Leifsonia shinshuensis]MCI0158811.1 carbohydrate ABC transporter permease [Leifsonia shinshuensis]